MRRISISELQKNPTKALENLPVEIIRYGQAVAIITEPSENFSEKNIQEAMDNAYGVEGDHSLGVVPENEFVPEFTPGFCSVCRGKRDDTKQVKYNDPNGEEIEQVLCRKHIKTLERHFENNGGGFI